MTMLSSNYEFKEYQVKYASLEEARKLLTSEDAFTSAWSDFDIDSRMGKAGSTKSELLEHIKAQALEWTKDDKENINASITRINKKLLAANISLSIGEVTLVKTTAEEEGGAAGYTRGQYIVIAESVISSDEVSLDKFMVHELFHVISRTNPLLREKLYQIIGFHMMESIEYPEVLKPYRITNPDATQTDSYIMLDVGGDHPVPCMMILYANKAYEGGSFFNYLNIGFLELDKESYKAKISDEGPVIHGMKDAKNFFQQVGRNTQYIIHPEEIVADNFAFAVLGNQDLVDQGIVQEILSALKGE